MKRSLAKRIAILLVCSALLSTHSSIARAQSLPITDGQVIPLWSGAAPGALGTDTTDIPALASLDLAQADTSP